MIFLFWNVIGVRMRGSNFWSQTGGFKLDMMHILLVKMLLALKIRLYSAAFVGFCKF